MLTTQQIDKFSNGLKNNKYDIAKLTNLIQDSIKNEADDYKTLEQSIAQSTLPETAKLSRLKLQQDTKLSDKAKNLLLETEYEATLDILEAAKKNYTGTKLTAIDIHIKTIEDKRDALPDSDAQGWRTLSQFPKSKPLAEDIGAEQARAILVACDKSDMTRLKQISDIHDTLSNTSPANKKTLEDALTELKTIAPNEHTLQGNKKVAEIIQEFTFNPHAHSAFQGQAMPPALNELENLVNGLHGAKQKIDNLFSELNQPKITSSQEKNILKQIKTQQDEIASTAYSLNHWLLSHQHDVLLSIEKEAANKLLANNEKLMFAHGFNKPSLLKFPNKKTVSFPNSTVPEKNNSLSYPKCYKEASPGTYGTLVKFSHPGNEGSIGRTTTMDMNNIVLPVHGLNSSDPKTQKFSLLEVLREVYGGKKDGSDVMPNIAEFNRHVKFEKDNSITITFYGVADKEKFYNALSNRNNEYIKWKNGEKDVDATIQQQNNVTASVRLGSP